MSVTTFQSKFKAISEQISKNGYCILDHIFKPAEFNAIQQYFDIHESYLKPAHIGPRSRKMLNNELRSDFMFWVDETDSKLQSYLQMIQSVTYILRQELYLPIRSAETQMALYKAGGHYSRHQDRHKNTDHRWITLVFYLNTEWNKKDGGELTIFLNELDGEKEVHVEPINNRCVIFKSELEHEVQLSYKDRKSFTTWFRDDLPVL